MDIEHQDYEEREEQIMILIDGLDEPQEDQDLLEKLVAEPTTKKKSSLDYDYKPAPSTTLQVEEKQTTELKTSNRSTSTCAESQAPVRRCFCMKTRCQKNYCECFRRGEACTSQCECVGCGNKERLFLFSSQREVIKCKCLKSHCLKKFCQCHSAGKKCGPECKCFECENMEEPMVEQKNEMNMQDHTIFIDI